MERFNILCIDDEEIVLSVLKRELELNSLYSVGIANSGEQALLLAKEKSFDAYLVDQYMPAMDGVTFVRKLKEIDSDPLVFFLTGQDFDGKAYKASLPDEESRGAYYFTKPWNESLFVGLAQALKSHKENKLLDKENQRLNRWIARFFEEASLVELLAEKPSMDLVLDRLTKRILSRDLVIGADIFLLSGKHLDLVRSDSPENKQISSEDKALALKALNTGALVQKTEIGSWNYFVPIGIKKQKIGLVHLKLKHMEDESLQFIDYIIYQGGLMIEQVLIQMQLTKALKNLEETQKELLKTEKNDFIYGLARWLMHNINNIICGLKGDNELIKIAWYAYSEDPDNPRKCEKLTHQLADSLPAMETAIQRLIHLIENFQFIANVRKAETKRSEFNRLIKVAVQNFLGLNKVDPKIVKITEKYDSHLEFAEVNREMIIRIMEDLLSKALESLGREAGTIEVQTKKYKNWAEISIADNGKSLATDSRRWLQEPSFSANIPLEMGGMELVVIKEAVSFHQGEINFTSKAGSGSTVRIRLPLTINKSSKNKNS